ncbi:hypothetical protein CEXT_785001 [Caerostris extrusa]|uniref:Uncharacterized protein n=1 Tax=Caerostris extrusa TaxID=172846 RepID=A0AAV4SHP5_CAEEX|nr:hypothetical protein CEXT_785001 [Caerostris extrusa]
MRMLGQLATVFTKNGGILIFRADCSVGVTSSSATSGVGLVERKVLVLLICGLFQLLQGYLCNQVFGGEDETILILHPSFGFFIPIGIGSRWFGVVSSGLFCLSCS